MQGNTSGIRCRPVEHQQEQPPGHQLSVQKRDDPRRLPQRNPGRRGVQVWLVTLQEERRKGIFPRGNGRHVLHARCVVEVLVRGAVLVPLRCPAAGGRFQRWRRGALEAMVQANPGLRSPATRMAGWVGEEGESEETQICAEGSFSTGGARKSWRSDYRSMPFP